MPTPRRRLPRVHDFDILDRCKRCGRTKTDIVTRLDEGCISDEEIERRIDRAKEEAIVADILARRRRGG